MEQLARDVKITQDNILSLRSEVNERMDSLNRSVERLQQSIKELQKQRTMNGGVDNRTSNNRFTKIDFPRFSGDDVEGWLYKCNHFFTIDETPINRKIRYAMLHLDGRALSWHLGYIKSSGKTVDQLTWDEYSRSITARFSDHSKSDAKSDAKLDDAQDSVLCDEKGSSVSIDPETATTWIYPENVPVRDYQIVFSAPSRPLVMQQIEACHNIVGIPQDKTVDMTGQTSPSTRVSLWKDKRVFFVTLQVLEKDIQSGKSFSFLEKDIWKWPKRKKEKNVRCRKFSNMASKLDSRWPVRRLDDIANVVVNALKEKKNCGMCMQEVRDMARLYIGDTGLIDYVLKSMNNVIVGEYIVRRAVNSCTGVLEYSLKELNQNDESVDRVDSVITRYTQNDIYKDIAAYLYQHILMDSDSEMVECAVRTIFDCTIFTEKLKVTYSAMEKLKVTEIVELEGLDDNEVIFGSVESGSEITVHGFGIERLQFRVFESLTHNVQMETKSSRNCLMCFPEIPVIEEQLGTRSSSDHRRKDDRVFEIAFVMLLFTTILICVVIVLVAYCYCSKRRAKKRKCKENPQMHRFQEIGVQQKLKLNEITLATKGFDQNRIIGEGASSIVYEANIPSCGNVAFKRFRKVSQSGSFGNQFATELATVVGCLRHKNLVQLHGGCCEGNELVLVYEYMPNGSLEKILQPRSILDRRVMKQGSRMIVQAPLQVTVASNSKAVVDGDSAGVEMVSAQNKRVMLQKQAAAASLVAEDFARRFESGETEGITNDVVGEDQVFSNGKVMCRLYFSGKHDRSERARKMLSCKSCNKKYHRSCLKSWAHDKDLFRWSSWICPSCRVCERWVQCHCDGISDEKYMQFQANNHLEYRCATCRGECYQIRDHEDAVQEFWRRRDKAEQGLIASLRAAAGLSTHEEIFAISPYSDDEDDGPPVKKEYGHSLKFSLKGVVDNSPKKNKEYAKKSAKKKYAKEKGFLHVYLVELNIVGIARFPGFNF